MALNLGTLVAFIEADRTGFRAGVRGARRDMEEFQRDANGRLRDIRGRFVKEGEAAGKGWTLGLRKGLGPLGGIIGNVIQMVGRLGPAALQAAKLSLVTVSALGLVSALSGLLGALAPVAGALLALPGLAAAGGFAFAVLKLGMSQLTDVIKAETTPAFEELKAIAGRELTAGLSTGIKGLVNVWLPALRDGVTSTSIALNSILRKAIEFAKSKSVVADWSTVFENAHLATANMETSLASVLSIFTTLSTVGSTFLPALATGLNGALEELAAFLVAARESGQLQGWIQSGITALRQLGGVLAGVGGIVRTVFDAASSGSGGLLLTINQLLSQVSAFLNSGVGQAALLGLFETVATVLDGLRPALFILAGVLATTVLPAILDIAKALGAVMPIVAGALAKGLEALAPAINPLAQVLAQVIVALTPLLPVIGQLAGLVAGILTASLGNLLKVVSPVIAALTGALGPAIPKIAAAFSAFATAVQPLAAQLGEQLGAALTQLLPALLALIPALIDGAAPALLAVAGAVVQILPELTALIPSIIKLLEAALPLIPILLTLAATLLTALVPAIVPVVTIIVDLATRILDVLVPALGFLVSYVVGPLIGALGWLIGVLGGALAAITGWVSGALKAILDIPSKVKNAFSSAGSWLVDAGSNILKGLMRGIDSMIDLVKGKFNKLTDLIPTWKGPADVDRRLLEPAGRSIIGGLSRGIDAEVPGLRRQLGGITAEIGALPIGGSSARLAAAVGQASASSAGGQRPRALTLPARGRNWMEDEFLEWMREIIRDNGGTVELALEPAGG